MLVTRNAQERLGIGDLGALPFPAELVEPALIDKITGSEAVHQGVVIEAEPLSRSRSMRSPSAARHRARPGHRSPQCRRDHALGGRLRRRRADHHPRHSPHKSGVLAKSASGALEHIDLIEVNNLADALGELHEAGFQTIGLDSDGPAELEKSFAGDKIALVLGAEGKGLRQKTRETVTTLARLDMPGAIRSLNVSNAAAVALYAARKCLRQSRVAWRLVTISTRYRLNHRCRYCPTAYCATALLPTALLLLATSCPAIRSSALTSPE